MRTDVYTAGPFLRSGAMFAGDDDIYRYRLWRYWEAREPSDPLVFCMMNPSVADAEKLDPTVRRCVGFAKDWGHDGLEVVNVFAYRATKPEDMVDAEEAGVSIIGPGNDATILQVAMGRRVVLACGNHKATIRRMQSMRNTGTLDALYAAAREVLCLKTTKDGWPGHPLYIPAATVPKKWGMP
jgi:hypothetical protein